MSVTFVTFRHYKLHCVVSAPFYLFIGCSRQILNIPHNMHYQLLFLLYIQLLSNKHN